MVSLRELMKEKLKESQEEISQEEKKIEIKKTLPERMIDFKILDESLERTAGFNIPNIHISQDDLWLLYRLKFGKGTRVKRSVLLPQFTEAFNKNLKKLKSERL